MRSLTQSLAFRLAALIGFLGVALGAFGAHALKAILESHGRGETWRTAVLYHLIHAVVLLLLAFSNQWRPRTWLCFAVGTLLFSGSLYLLSLFSLPWLGPITPIGGLFLLAGWLTLITAQRLGHPLDNNDSHNDTRTTKSSL